MAGDEAAELQSLTSFSAEVTLSSERTTLDIRTADGSPPVARMTKAGALRQRAAYELFTGPDLKTAAGTLSASGALDAGGAPVGIVNLSGGRKADSEIHPLSGGLTTYASDNPTKWRVVQPGLPPLVAEGTDPGARLSYNKVTDAMDRLGFGVKVPDYLAPMTFRFSAAGCAGFTVTLTSRKSRLDVTVHDPRVDRRLILSCLAALALKVMETPRREATEAGSLFRRLRKA
ncbi:hypothetical protein [Streptomyces sp. HPF1205]|uniref:hypothetical protein n=1 Tax=Streptomyces sp. HPF1205 TaxID=2873262 RepID=UPI001CEC291E|nr:hypothetical protein [Streptomyces sp. HPF1205]